MILFGYITFSPPDKKRDNQYKYSAILQSWSPLLLQVNNPAIAGKTFTCVTAGSEISFHAIYHSKIR